MPNSASDDDRLSGQNLEPKDAELVRRVPPWGPIVIAFLLLLIAFASLVFLDQQPLAGIIIGYVAAYWLPSLGPTLRSKNGG